MTGRDLVKACLRLIGALAPAESLDATEATDGLAALNRMISSWSTEGLLIHAITAETPLTLAPGDGTYTMGTAGSFTNRPVRIVSAFIRDGSTDLPPMRMLTPDEYAAIPDKSTQSTYPHSLYDDGGYPLRTLTLYPVPSAAKSLVLLTNRVLSSIATLDTEVSLPPGYERALVYNGGMELAPEYSRAASAEIVNIAAESKANLKRANHRPLYMHCDDVPAGSCGAFNIYTGGYH